MSNTLYFHCAMSCVALARLDKKRHGKQQKRRAKTFLKKFKGWAAKGNPNVQHYTTLLEAELASLNGQPFAIAAAYYENAIAVAGRYGFTNDDGLAHEKFGDHCSRNGDDVAAAAHYQIALKRYETWGAQARITLLRERSCMRS